MPAITPNFSLPYPEGTDPIDVAGDVSRLALAVDGMKAYIDTHLTAAEGDAAYVNLAGDSMTGALTITRSTAGNVLVLKNTSTDKPQLYFQNAAGAEIGSIIGDTSWLEVNTSLKLSGGILSYRTAAGANISLKNFDERPRLYFTDQADAGIGYLSAEVAAKMMRIHGYAGVGIILAADNVPKVYLLPAGTMLWAKTATNAATVGTEIGTTGSIWLTKNDQLSALIYANQLASSHVGYGTWRFNGTQIGSIQRASGNASVTYSTTSHAPWKAEVADLDDAAALAYVESLRPVSFRWKRRANGDLSEDGTPSGDPVHGFIAQELVNVAPEAVAPGKGTEAEHWAWVDRAAAAATAAAAREVDPDAPEAEDPGMDPFEPWGVDASKLIPDLVGAVRALSHFNTQLVTALTSILNPADPATFSSLADLIPEG